MRFLFVSCPVGSHISPMIPLAQAAVDGGHEVAIASGSSMSEYISGAGFRSLDIGPAGMEEAFATLIERIGGEPGAGLPPEEILAWFMPNLFAATVAPMMLPGLLEAVQGWRPDMIVHETMALAAPLAAAAAGLPSVQHAISLLMPALVYRLIEEPLAPLWQQHDLTPEPMGGSFRGPCLSIAPPSLETPVDEAVAHQVQPLKPVGFSATSDQALPAWVADLPDQPTVYVTMGTFMNSERSIFRAAIEGLSGEAVNVIVTVGRSNSPDWLDPLPPNARVEQYIPQSLLLPYTSVIVSHAGSGTLFPSLGASLPQVLVPQGADNFLNAERCQAAGAGRVLLPGQVTPGAVRDAVRTVLDDPAYKKAAGRLADEIQAMPGPDEVVRGLRSNA